MQFDFYLSRVRRDDDGPDILRVDNCSEVDVAGNFYKQDGKYYDDCCDLENEDAPECGGPWTWLTWLIVIINVIIVVVSCGFFLKTWFIPIFGCFWDCVKSCCKKCYNTCCACCEPQPIVRNENNAARYRTEGSNISTISANIRQPPSEPPTPSPTAPPSSEIQEGLIDRLPRSKASKNQCTGRS